MDSAGKTRWRHTVRMLPVWREAENMPINN
jgi:hypothetical protein